MYRPKIYTVESVTSGHPDKVCDQISDAILDACLAQDPMTRAGIEVFGCHNWIVVGGELTAHADVNYEKIARDVYRDIGHQNRIKVLTNVAKQSPDIAQGVDSGGAGDQGIMYGYATDETEEKLPQAVVLVHQLAAGLERLRKTDPRFAWLGPDGKTQVTVERGKVRTVLVSCQHDEAITQSDIKRLLKKHLIAPIIGDAPEILVNPTGKFLLGGIEADTGLTGRKIMVDTYCGLVPHGGGAFSGKDPTKVDRSASYMCRFVAKNLVAHGYASEALVSVAYAIGRAEPLMVTATGGDGDDLSRLVKKKFDFRPQAIIERLNLRRPIYFATAAYGHFGKPNLPWEELLPAL